jgi:hypothetical protein
MGAETSVTFDNQMQLNDYADNVMAYNTDANLILPFGETYSEIEFYSDLGYNGECQ